MTRRTGTFANVVLLALLLAMLGMIGNYGLNRPVSFDGAMNLQVAQSLARGEGYVRHYEGVRAFPMEVQTNVPFVLPAALVFKLFGVGLAQSQLVNFAYLLLFLGLVVWIVRRFFGTTLALCAALACLLVPGFHRIGMNGWGEIAALSWWLAGTCLLLRDVGPGADARRLLGGGLCLGLALATKTVLLIGLGATGTVFAAAWLWIARRDPRAIARAAALAVIGIALPLLAVEAWRWLAMGSADYGAWWGNQFAAIVWQSGASPAHAGASADRSVAHFGVLATLLGLPGPVIVAWLFLPLLASVPFLLRTPLQTHAHRLWLALLLLAGVYLAWWLLVTPDSHTRLRRILIGLVAVQLVWAFVLGTACLAWRRHASSTGRRAALALLVVAGLLPQAALAWRFASELDTLRRPDMDRFYRVVEAVRTLPPGASLFTKGFLSAPELALYSGRRVEDIDLFTAGDLARLGTGYLLLDPPAVKEGRFTQELRRYPERTVVADLDYEVHAVDFRRRVDPFSPVAHDAATTRAAVDFTHGRYPFVYGMQPAGKEGWRWATTDAELLLRYGGEPAVRLVLYRPDKPYARPRPLTLQVALDDCPLGERRLEDNGRHVLVLPIPERCRPAQPRAARVQLVADNMLRMVPGNLRQMSYVVLGAGFSAEAAPR